MESPTMLRQLIGELSNDPTLESVNNELVLMCNVDKGILRDYLQIICKLIDNKINFDSDLYEVNSSVSDRYAWLREHGQKVPYYDNGG